MFDSIKSFMRGWSAQGNSPQFSPHQLPLYTNAVLAFLEDGHQRFALRGIIVGEDDLASCFEFSYDALALSVASAAARVHANGDEAKHRYVNQALSHMATAIGEGKPEYQIRHLIGSTAELDHLYSLWKLAGGECSRRDFLLTDFSYGQLLDTVYPSRTLQILKVIFECADERLQGEDHLRAFVTQCARQLLSHMTVEPTSQKEAALAIAIAKLWFSLNPHKQ